ncbi:Urb2/Npa2 family-domain-containing protein [Gilbertella persicaria]|uniref:Urb2/Npa2 family-domain-containing protein n=1 Tax=Gilbertella persicaria TaxID=101096 RepID=UPI00221EF897|nr:Urb2/Npa2 family-domain-containing protein [Gilbertella persicaria]KAI8087792.1 Urb2/Npa2 family-domain-containing protein [Gilbertella persicaria]
MSLINDSNSTSISAQLLNKTLLRSANFYEAKCFKDCNIQTIFNTLVHLSKNELSTTGLTSHTAITMVSKLDTSKPLSIDHQTIEPLLAVLKSTEDLMDQDSDARSSDNIEKVASLMKLLLVFPIEYFEKNERPQAIYLATLIDIWGVQCTHADPVTRIKLSLMCRALQLRFIGYFSTHSILGLNAIALDWFVSSQQQWKSQEREALDSLERVTNKLDQHILRKMIMNAGSKTPDEHSLTYLQDTLRQRVVGLEKNDQKVTLTKLINLLSAINSVLANSKSSEVDLSNAVYAVNALSQISSYITCSLNKAKKIVSSILEQVTKANQSEAQIIADHEGTFEQIKLVFNLTRLVQEYARIVGPTVDEAIGIEKLSKTLTDLASPFIQFLQSALQFNKSAVLHMTTEFIAAFCSILTRYQQIDSTKRVLAAVWFVYSLVFKTGDQESIDILSKAFTSWVQSLSKEQYNIVFESFLEQAEDEANHRVDSSKEQRTLVLLSLFSLLQSNCVDSEKNRLRKQIPVIMLKLSLIAGKTTSFRYLQEFLKLLVQLTSDQSYHFKDYDASLLLSCLLQVAHPTAPERFKGQMNAALANALFIDICSILSNLITHHKEQVVYMMPPFIALVQSMLHCFKSSHVSLVTGKKRKHIDESKLKMGRTISLFSDYAPLDDVSAQRFARVLTTIPQKQPTLSSASKSTQTLQRMVAKHTPSILIEYFTIQSNPNMSIVQPSIKSILTNALYDILDLCSEADRNYVLSCLDGSGKTLFKTFYTSWKENHKYTGQ